MAVRETSGAGSSSIIMLPGATSGMTHGSIVTLVKRNDTSDDGLGGSAQNSTTSSATFAERIKLAARANPNNDLSLSVSATGSASGLTVVNADGWVLCVVTKQTGSVFPIFYRYVLSTSTMSTATGGTALANATALDASSRWSFGKDEFTNRTNARWATSAVWKDRALTAAEVGSIADNRSTRQISILGPTALWDFNQASTATAVTDLTGGGADETASSTTTVITGDDPPGWVFGAAADPPNPMETPPGFFDPDLIEQGWY